MFISDADRQRKRDAQQKQRAFLEEQLADRRTERRAETRRERQRVRSEREELGLDADDAADLLDARDRRARRNRRSATPEEPRRRGRDKENKSPCLLYTSPSPRD